MNRFHPVKSRLRVRFSLAMIATAIYATSSGFVAAADAKAAAADAKTETKAKKPAKKLTGSELYAINCNRCHPERYPTEFNSSQWKSLMLHMRVRANLPAKQAKEIIKYLQEDSGS